MTAAGLLLAAAVGAGGSEAPRAVRHLPVTLTTLSGEAQAALDALLAEMRAVVERDAALPYAPPGSEDELWTAVRNTNYQLLSAGLSRVTQLFNGVFFQSPEAIAGNAADPRQYFDFFTPDIYYRVTAGLAPGATYLLTGRIGAGTEHFSLSTLAITAGAAQTQTSLELGHGLHVNPDGSFAVAIGPSEPWWAPNYLDDSSATAEGAASLLVRDMLGDWALGGGNVSIRCVADCPPFFAIPEGGLLPGGGGAQTPDSGSSGIGSIDSLLTTLFTAFAQVIGPFNQRSIDGAYAVGMGEPVNTMFALSPETHFGAGLESAVVSGGNFDLADGEALILKLPNVASAYSGIELMNVFGAALPYTLAQTTLNNTQAYHADDGYTYYVVSATNPGVANWLDSGAVSRGEIFARFENVTDRDGALGLPVTTELVPVADVRDHLPADTPTVSPAEYAADMAQRVLSYDYALDSARMHAQPDWVIQQLLWHALPAVLGADNFDAVFGSEPVTPMALRFTPALSPNFDAVGQGLWANPLAGLSALAHNLPLAWSDISLPVKLLVGQLPLALLIPGYPSIGAVIHEALLDPNTSITAGLLNARDDLATAVLAATGGFPTELGAQATAQWANMDELVASTPAMDYGDLFGLLFNLGSGFDADLAG